MPRVSKKSVRKPTPTRAALRAGVVGAEVEGAEVEGLGARRARGRSNHRVQAPKRPPVAPRRGRRRVRRAGTEAPGAIEEGRRPLTRPADRATSPRGGEVAEVPDRATTPV